MDKIEATIIEQIEDFNKTLDKPVDLSQGSDSILFGSGGALDSVDFVSLIVDIEQAVEEKTGKMVVLTDARAMSQKHSPFRTVGSLAEYVQKLLEEA